MVTDTLSKPEHVEALAQECSDECDRLVEWARERHVSPTSLARLFLRRATESAPHQVLARTLGLYLPHAPA